MHIHSITFVFLFTVTLQRPKNQQKKLHSQRPVLQPTTATMDPAIIPVITMPVNTVHNHTATVTVTINGNSMDRDMGMHTAMHGVVTAAVDIIERIGKNKKCFFFSVQRQL